MRSLDARNSIPILLLLVSLMIASVPGSASAYREMVSGWPDEEGDTRPWLLGGGGAVQADENIQEEQPQVRELQETLPEGFAGPRFISLMFLLRDVVFRVWLP
jgi:hypothetical protein